MPPSLLRLSTPRLIHRGHIRFRIISDLQAERLCQSTEGSVGNAVVCKDQGVAPIRAFRLKDLPIDLDINGVSGEGETACGSEGGEGEGADEGSGPTCLRGTLGAFSLGEPPLQYD